MKVFCAIFIILSLLSLIQCELPAKCLKETAPTATANCRQYRYRYAYDQSRNMCVHFNDGRCVQNENHFESENDCKKTCIKKSECMETPAFKGRCTASRNRWSYYQGENVCKLFIYGGCKGNGNNFGSQFDCNNRCVHK